jgi:hypothetical protein
MSSLFLSFLYGLFLYRRWFFHCESDNVVSVSETDNIVEALRREQSKSGGTEVEVEDTGKAAAAVRFTRYTAEDCAGDKAAKGG